MADAVKEVSTVDDDESPGLFVAGCGGCHGGAQQGVDLGLGDGLGGVGAHACAGHYVVDC